VIRGIPFFFVFDRCVTHTKHTKHTHTDTGRSVPDDRSIDRSRRIQPSSIVARSIESNRIESNPHPHPNLHLHPNVVVVARVASRYRAATRVTLVVTLVVVDVVFER